MFGIPLFAVNVGQTFDPTTLSLTGYWRADYSGSPWAGTTSIGSSGSNSLSEATNPPTTGTTQNGWTPASFNGTSSKLTAGGTIATYTNALAFSGWCVGYVTSNANPRPLFSDGNTSQTIYVRVFNNTGTTTLKFSVNNAAVLAEVSGITLNAYQFFTWRYNGTNVQVGVNAAPGSAGGTSSVAYSTSLSPLTGPPQVGFNTQQSTGFYTQNMLELAITNTALTDQNFLDIKSYVNSRYGLSL